MILLVYISIIPPHIHLCIHIYIYFLMHIYMYIRIYINIYHVHLKICVNMCIHIYINLDKVEIKQHISEPYFRFLAIFSVVSFCP